VARRPSDSPPIRMHLKGDGERGVVVDFGRGGGEDSKATRFLLYWKSEPVNVP